MLFRACDCYHFPCEHNPGTPPQKLQFSKVHDPCEFPKSVTIKPAWLMTSVLWILRKLGFEVLDLRKRGQRARSAQTQEEKQK